VTPMSDSPQARIAVLGLYGGCISRGPCFGGRHRGVIRPSPSGLASGGLVPLGIPPTLAGRAPCRRDSDLSRGRSSHGIVANLATFVSGPAYALLPIWLHISGHRLG
jgi:hypothetical protein